MGGPLGTTDAHSQCHFFSVGFFLAYQSSWAAVVDDSNTLSAYHFKGYASQSHCLKVWEVSGQLAWANTGTRRNYRQLVPLDHGPGRVIDPALS